MPISSEFQKKSKYKTFIHLILTAESIFVAILCTPNETNYKNKS